MLNNKNHIIREWKRKYELTKSPYFAQSVYSATGEYPDGNNHIGQDLSQPKGQDEIERIREDITSNITYPF